MKLFLDMRFEPKLLLLAAAFGLAAFFVPALFRSASIALGLAMLVLSPMPDGTRKLTFAVMVGLATGTTAITSFAVSIFQDPITREFGWDQSEYALAITIITIILVLIGPFAGRMFDRVGVRKFTLSSVVFVGLALISLRWLTDSLLHFYVTLSLIQLLGVGTSAIAFSRIVARWFDKRRGQAFGTALAGVGIGGAVVSALSQFMIGEFGWRDAYVGLGLFMLCVTLPILFFLLRDTPQQVGLAPDGLPLGTATAGEPTPQAEAPVTGLTAAQSRRTATFWIMAFAIFIMAIGTGGVLLQLFPILRAQGIEPSEAAAIQGSLGLALIMGRACAGYLMDRFFAPYVAAIILLFPMVGTMMFATGVDGWQATVAAMAFGVAAGAEVDVIAYLITRYFGTRAYSENYGWQYGAFAMGSGCAPILTTLSIDRLGSYSPILWVYGGAFALASVLIARMGRYPDMDALTAKGEQAG